MPKSLEHLCFCLLRIYCYGNWSPTTNHRELQQVCERTASGIGQQAAQDRNLKGQRLPTGRLQTGPPRPLPQLAFSSLPALPEQLSHGLSWQCSWFLLSKPNVLYESLTGPTHQLGAKYCWYQCPRHTACSSNCMATHPLLSSLILQNQYFIRVCCNKLLRG